MDTVDATASGVFGNSPLDAANRFTAMNAAAQKVHSMICQMLGGGMLGDCFIEVNLMHQTAAKVLTIFATAKSSCDKGLMWLGHAHRIKRLGQSVFGQDTFFAA